MSDSLVLANQMIDDGAISIINDMVKRGGLEDNIVGNLTIALVSQFTQSLAVSSEPFHNCYSILLTSAATCYFHPLLLPY